MLRRELRPGTPLAIRPLAGALGVSVTPVRDALTRLASDGLVTIGPRRRGTRVTPVSADAVCELYQLRLMVEPAAAEVAAGALTAAELAALGRLARRLAGPPAGRGPAGYLRDLATDIDFHAAIVRGARNRHLDRLYEGLRAAFVVARAIYPRRYVRTARRRGEHRRILDALRRRDGPAAREAVRVHLDRALEDILRHLDGLHTGASPAAQASPPAIPRPPP